MEGKTLRYSSQMRKCLKKALPQMGDKVVDIDVYVL
jgi:hypothetical protein